MYPVAVPGQYRNQATESSTAIGDSVARVEPRYVAVTVMETSTTAVDRPGERHFDQFFTERYERMVGLAVGLIDHRATAEEIVQEAFQRVWLRWASLTRPACYLRTTVVNSCNDELRRRRVRRQTDPVLHQRHEAEAHYLIDALADVDLRRRQALVLRYYAGHTVSEVAEAMAIPTGTAKSLIHRGLADLRDALDGSIPGADR